MDRAKRVRTLKKVIVGTVIFLILLPTALCIGLFIRLSFLQKDLLLLRETNASYSEQITSLSGELKAVRMDLTDVSDRLRTVENAPAPEPKPALEDETAEAAETWPKKVYLTFDDGPSGHTEEILDILDRYGVKGNFFVCYTPNEEYWKYYRRILDEGHMLGIHSYSHVYNEIYASEEAFEKDVRSIRDFVREQTDGFEASYYRFPGGSSNLESRISLRGCTEWLEQEGLVYFDWNLSSQDATNPMQPSETIYRNATYGSDQFEEVVILMHDLGNKDSTVEALPYIIEYYQGIGASIGVIDQNTMPVQNFMQ